MGRAEAFIIFAVLLVGAGSFALEGLGPGAVQVIAISVCLLLILLMAIGLFFRVTTKRRAEIEAARRETVTSEPEDSNEALTNSPR